MRVANTFLADRAYDDEGNLVSRKLEGAVIKDRVAVLERVTQLLEHGTVTTITGKRLKLAAQSILLHGDTARRRRTRAHGARCDRSGRRAHRARVEARVESGVTLMP